MKKDNKSVKITFRLTEEEYAPFEKVALKSGWSKSELFRLYVTGKIDLEKRLPRENEKINRLLFYFNKTSNNLNQIAKQLNAAHIEGKLTEKKLMIGLNELIKINENFHYGIKLVTKD